MSSVESESFALSPDFLRKLEYLRVVARRSHAGRFSALHRSRQLGRGIDFADHRSYSPGDDFKDIDWNLFGRLDRLMVRLAQEENELNLHLLVDCSRSMSGSGDCSKGEYGRRVATALSYLALSQLDRVHVHPFGDQLLPTLSPPRNKARAVQVYRHLEAVEPSEQTDLEAVARAFCAVAPPRGVALVVSDFLAPGGWKRGLDLLRHARFEVALLQVSAGRDEAVELRGEVILQDSETGRPVRVRLTDRLVDAYRQEVAAHSQALSEYARSHNLFYAHARSDEPFEEMVLRTMRTERFLG